MDPTILGIINSTGRPFPMNESPKEHLINPVHDDDDEPTSLESFQLKEIMNETEESGHSNHDHRNRYEALNPGKAKLAQGSNRALFILIITVCLRATDSKYGESNDNSENSVFL